MNILKKLVQIIFIISIITFVATFFFKETLPSPERINSQLTQAPIQTEGYRKPFTIEKEDGTYTLEPLFDYELYGLITADYNSENFFDFIHKRSNDEINTKDICVVWGENISSGIYEKINYTHGEFTCYAKLKSSYNTREWWEKFDVYELSNNHLIPANDAIYQKMKSSSPGDQVHLKGYLVKYQWLDSDGNEWSRSTSTTRNDTGNASCETIYVTSYEIIVPGNEIVNLAHSISIYTAAISLIVLAILAYVTYS